MNPIPFDFITRYHIKFGLIHGCIHVMELYDQKTDSFHITEIQELYLNYKAQK